MKNQDENKVWFTVLVAALGYFVDIFDLQLFNVIGKQSLGEKGLNLSPEQIDYYYDYVLFNFQMGGMLLGGLLWGIMGDKLGRKSTLFGSILIYSLANFANGFVTDTTTYSILRFVAGFGLAGELGAAITLVAELMTKETRGIGTMIIVAMGALGL
jgi:MFS transporter, putative metabolite:H+ symporter